MHWHLLTAALLVAAPTPTAEKKDSEKIQGEWGVVSAEFGGEKAPDDEVKKTKVVIKDNTFTIKVGEKVQLAKFKLDPGKRPKTIDITHEKKGAEPNTLAGIYELKGDELRICFTKRRGGERPTKFVTKDEVDLALLILKRVNKDK